MNEGLDLRLSLLAGLAKDGLGVVGWDRGCFSFGKLMDFPKVLKEQLIGYSGYG